MTPEEIQAIRERAEAATEGPWANYGDIRHEVYPVLTGDEEDELDNIANDVVRLADAEFIAHAREDVPALLAEVERLHRKFAAVSKLWAEAVAERTGVDELRLARILDGSDQ